MPSRRHCGCASSDDAQPADNRCAGLRIPGARERIGRTAILLLDYVSQVPSAPSPAEREKALGVPLIVYLRIGFALFTAMAVNCGAISGMCFAPSTSSRSFNHRPANTLADLRPRAYREIPAGYDHDPLRHP
jgi:hypothetical protein